MLSSFFFGGGGSGGAVGHHHHGGAIRDEKAARRGSSNNPATTSTNIGGTANTNSRSWTSLFLKRDKNNSTPDSNYSNRSANRNGHDVVKKSRKSPDGITAASISTSTLSLLELELTRPAQLQVPGRVPVQDQTGSSPSAKPHRHHSSAVQHTSATTTTAKTKASSKLQRQSAPVSSKKTSNHPQPSPNSLDSKRGNSTPNDIVVGQPTGGYSSSKPIQAEPRIPPSFRHSAFGPALLAQKPLFPKPAAYLYTVRSALSSTMSASSSSPPPLDPPKRHIKKDRSPSPTRRHSTTRKVKAPTSRDVEHPDITCPELPTPPDSRRATPAHSHRPRESSRNLTTIKEDAPERSKERSKRHRKHKRPEEREERERERRKRRLREAEEDRLEEIRRHRDRTPVSLTPEQPTRTPPPPPAGEPIPSPRYTTPVIPRRESATPGAQSMLRASATTIFQAIKTVGSKSSKDQLSNSSPKSSGTRVVLQQTDQSIKVKVDSPNRPKNIHRDDDSTDSDELEQPHTPEAAEFPIAKNQERKGSAQVSPNVKIVGEDVSEDLANETETIDFLLPYGGLREQFDSGYEIEQELPEDELGEEDSEGDDETVHAPGAQPVRKKSHHTIANSAVNVDPLSHQLPVLLSLVDNTVTAYETILETQGSFAVGIGGYQPVARRLLEKVGKLFSRELPPEAATWGETLEYISGRKEYPELCDVDFNDDDAISEFFDHDDEKMFIFNACLEEHDVLDPAVIGLRRLMEEDVTPEETAIYLTSYPHIRPLLLACRYMTDDELDILYSKRATAFLDVDVAVRSDKQREVTECAELSKGIDETVKQLEATIARMKTVQTGILKRKKGIEAHLSIHAPNDDETPTLPAEIQTAIDEIQNEDIIKMEERKRRRKELREEAEAEDDGDTLLPDDSISQINPYRARYIPQSVTRAYQEAQTRAAASVAQVPASVASTKTSTSILQEYLTARAPPRQTQMGTHGHSHMAHSAGYDPSNPAGMGHMGVPKKPNAYLRMALPSKVYGTLKPGGNSGEGETPEVGRSGTPDTHQHLQTPSPYDDALYRSNSRGSTKTPVRNVSGASSKKSGLFSKKPVEDMDRGCTPVIVHGGVGGYGSSKPVGVPNDAGVNIRKDKEKGDRERERRKREKGKSGSGSRRKESYAEKPRR
ncbi:uncharacterized protein DFL_008875 [Arthrobotrys flagrans]|uniref:Uncharacterized protein n=1 Tax=Arthrobotrys flagrans TaxID=97331 RepID=A0A436ZQ82_ARTFL|nr:hypothetical protein DFL_008875 [Arthrobotrys flagrans]